MLHFISILSAIGALIIIAGASIKIYYVCTSKKVSPKGYLLEACGWCLVLPFLSNLALNNTTEHPIIMWIVLTCCALCNCICNVILLYKTSTRMTQTNIFNGGFHPFFLYKKFGNDSHKIHIGFLTLIYDAIQKSFWTTKFKDYLKKYIN